MNEVVLRKPFWDRLGEGFDQAVMAISPVRGFKRAAARNATKMLRSYRGAERDRTRKDWMPGGASADADLLPELADMRERSRDLNRNNMFAAAMTNEVVSQSVGAGIRLQSQVDAKHIGMSPEQAATWRRMTERAWRHWMKTADSQNRLHFYQMQALVARQILENGESIVLPLMITDEPWRKFNLALEVVESDRLETPRGNQINPNIRDGVELGTRGQPIAYHLRTRHPGDVSLGRPVPTDVMTPEWRRYPAMNALGRKNVLHLYTQKRPGQTRGEPFLAPVLAAFKDMGDFIEAQVVAERIAACFAAFVTKNDPLSAATSAAGSTNTRNQRVQEFEPGMISYLAPGEEISFASPNRPGNTLDPFATFMLRAIGSALGMPYELVLKDFSKTNYSSARAALIEARRFFRCYQMWLAETFCQPVWEWVLEEAWLREEIPAVDLFSDEREDWMKAQWIAPGWGWVDPVKEVQSSKEAIDSNLSTLAEECAAQGRDWEEVLEQRQREQEKADELGLTPVMPAGPASTQPPTTQPDGEGDGTDAVPPQDGAGYPEAEQEKPSPVTVNVTMPLKSGVTVKTHRVTRDDKGLITGIETQEVADGGQSQEK